MPFFDLGNPDISFAEKELTWRSYATAEALATTSRVEIIGKKEFTEAALSRDTKGFVVHAAAVSTPMHIHPSRRAQIGSIVGGEIKIPAE